MQINCNKKINTIITQTNNHDLKIWGFFKNDGLLSVTLHFFVAFCDFFVF